MSRVFALKSTLTGSHVAAHGVGAHQLQRGCISQKRVGGGGGHLPPPWLVFLEGQCQGVTCTATPQQARSTGGEAGTSEAMHITGNTPLLHGKPKAEPTTRQPSLGRHLLGLRGAGQNGGPNGGVINPVRDRLDA